MEPPMTESPDAFPAGMASPVIRDSSTVDVPCITMASTGIFSPGMTLIRSPFCTSSTGMSSSLFVCVCVCDCAVANVRDHE